MFKYTNYVFCICKWYTEGGGNNVDMGFNFQLFYDNGHQLFCFTQCLYLLFCFAFAELMFSKSISFCLNLVSSCKKKLNKTFYVEFQEQTCVCSEYKIFILCCNQNSPLIYVFCDSHNISSETYKSAPQIKKKSSQSIDVCRIN